MYGLRRVRYDMYTLFLSLPDVVSQEQMLQHLPHLQLGLRNDVHATLLRPKVLHLEPAGTLDSAAGPLGDNFFSASRAFFGEHQRLFGLRELLRETMS